jgi:hypothetical protein
VTTLQYQPAPMHMKILMTEKQKTNNGVRFRSSKPADLYI